MLLRRLQKARSLSLRGLTRAAEDAAARVNRLVEAALVEVGDEVRGQRGIRKRKAGPAVEISAVAPELNEHQAQAFAALSGALGTYSTFVLQGITGSGKTEVYLRLIAEARRAGKGALVLVPEIALTPQLAARFRGPLRRRRRRSCTAPCRPASGGRPGAGCGRGEVGIALGARSAVFAPVRALGVVVVDEEHDGSFKQEEGVRYHGRDVAVVRAQKAGAVAVLGSATPSLETYRNVTLGAIPPPAAAHPRQPQRGGAPAAAGGDPRPEGAPARARRPAGAAAGRGPGRHPGRRRAEHPVPQPARVLDADPVPGLRPRAALPALRRLDDLPPRPQPPGVPLLRPHGEHPRRLPRSAGRRRWRGWGWGPSRWRAWCARSSPPPGWRAWTGTPPTRARGAERLLKQVHDGEIDILVGTQMVTKGHDFEKVTLVGCWRRIRGCTYPTSAPPSAPFSCWSRWQGGPGGESGRGGCWCRPTTPSTPPSSACAPTTTRAS